MSEKRRDRKDRILRSGERRRKDGRYAYKRIDAAGKPRFVYSWKLEATDRTSQENVQQKMLQNTRDARNISMFKRFQDMTKILFVCHGNICRSPMAEFIMKDLVRKAGLEKQFHIESAATSTEEIGNPVYPPARRKLAEHGISCAGKTARQLTKADSGRYDLLIGMDSANLRNMRRICGGDPDGRLHLLMEYADHPGDVADPWYTGDFDTTWRDVLAGCQGLLHYLVSEGMLD